MISASVVLATYNRADRIGPVLSAILRQDHPPSEIVVVDDGSTDATEAVVRHISRSIIYTRIENSGVCAARNLGVSLSTGSHIAFCDSDDHWHPDYLRRQMALYQAVPELAFSFANFNVIWKHHVAYSKFESGPSGFWRDWAGMPGHARSEASLLTRPLYARLLEFQPVFPSALVVSRRLFERVGGFKPELGRTVSEDLEFTLRCAQHGPVAALHRPLVDIIKHESNFSADPVAGLQGEISILKHARAFHAPPPDACIAIDDQMVRRAIDGINLAFGTMRCASINKLAGLVPADRRGLLVRAKIALARHAPPLAFATSRALSIAQDLRRLLAFAAGRDVAAPEWRADQADAVAVLHLYNFFTPDYTGDGLFFGRLFRLMDPQALSHFVIAMRTVGRSHPAVATEPYVVERDGVQVGYFASEGHSRRWSLLWLWIWLVRYAHRFHVVHMHTHIDRFFVSHLILRLMGLRIISSSTLDDTPEQLVRDYRPLFRPLVRVLLRRIDVFLGISPATFCAAPRGALVSLPRTARRILIPQGAPTYGGQGEGAVSRGQLGLSKEHIVLVSVGSIIARKDTRFLIATLPELLRVSPDIRLLLVGPKTDADYYSSCIRAATALGVLDRVSFAGFTERPEDYLRISDIYVSSSRSEGFGNAHLEAMGVGLPTVARLLPGVNDFFVNHSVDGFLFEKSEEYIATVSRLASDPALRREVGREAEARVQSRYSLQLAADRYSMLYRELATSQEPRWEDFTIAMR